MPTIVHCPSCNCKLQVPPDLLGREVRCPTCKNTFQAAESQTPGDASTKTATESKVPTDAIALMELGPPSESPPSPMISTKESFKPCPSCGDRVPVDANYCRHCGEDLTGRSERRPEFPWRQQVRRDCEPHRGALIITFGILSIVLSFMCMGLGFFFGLPTLFMGRRDLKKIAANTMDPEGKGLTLAGWICSIIGTILRRLLSAYRDSLCNLLHRDDNLFGHNPSNYQEHIPAAGKEWARRFLNTRDALTIPASCSAA